jgi:23S rRNA pseudouridine1911/1915/1917 synthase
MFPEPRIIFQDRSLLVIDKPAGWVVNRAISVKTKTIQDWVEEGNYLNSIPPSGVNQETIQMFISRSGVVHRLDKETSGLLLIAKDPLSFTLLQQQFAKRQVTKTYLALVHGLVKPKKGTISAPVGRQTFNRKRFGVIPGGRKSVTKYLVISYYSSSKAGYSTVSGQVDLPAQAGKPEISPLTEFSTGSNNKEHKPNFTLLKLFPHTGRTHQLRVHLKYISHPIVCDPLYLGKKTLKKDRQWCPRLFLHAQKLQFSHPSTKKSVSFSSTLPSDLQEML